MAANPLLDPNSTLSGNALLAAAKGLANAQTSPVIASLAQMIAQNNAQTSGAINQVGGYFNQLGQQAQQGAGQQQSIADALNSQLAQIGQEEQSQLRGIGQNATDSVLKYSPQSDTSNSLAQPALQSLASEIARQQGLAAQNQGAQRSFGATQGANYRGMAAANLGTFALKGQESLGNIARAGQLRNQPLQAKIANEHAIYGADLATALGKLRQQEINNNISRAGLGIRTQANKITAANDLAKNALGYAGIKAANSRNAAGITAANSRNAANIASREQIATANRAARAQGKGPVYTPTGQRVLSPQQQQVRFAQVDSLRQLIRDAQRPLSQNDAKRLGMQPGQKLSEAQIRGLLTNGQNPSKVRYDPALIDAAYALNGYGYVTAKQINELNKLGLIVGNRYARPPSQKQVVKNAAGVTKSATSGLGKIFG